VSAFRATLEEVVEADLILHVIDVSDPDREEKEKVVRGVLKDIGAGDHRTLTVYNKADLLEDPAPKDGVLISAVTGTGLNELLEEIVQNLTPARV
jgi:GTP-binding protein HflX